MPFALKGRGNDVRFDEPWARRVCQDAAFWHTYGCPFDARAVLPAREYQAHLCILKGEAERAEELRKEAERAARG